MYGFKVFRPRICGRILKGTFEMVSYTCTIRTNYFHVKDEDKLRSLISRTESLKSPIHPIHLWSEKDSDGKTVFSFGVYDGIVGIKNDEANFDSSDAYDVFINSLQECVADDDAIIMIEAGHEKLRVVGLVTIITSKGCEYLSVTESAVKEAAKMLENPHWTTVFSY